MSGQNPESAMAQLNLITNAHTFLEPSIRLEQSTRSALPTVEDQSASLQLSNASRQMANALKDLKACVGRAQQVCCPPRTPCRCSSLEHCQDLLTIFFTSFTSGFLFCFDLLFVGTLLLPQPLSKVSCAVQSQNFRRHDFGVRVKV